MFKCGYLSGSLWVGNNPKHVYPCCYTNKEYNLTISENLNHEYLNNKTLLDMRRTALRGETPDLCKGCELEKKKSLYLFKNGGIVKEIISYEDVERLYISLGNVCNFKCVICSESQSHLIAKEINPLQNSYIKNQSYFDFLIDNLHKMKNLRMVQFTGGEPFLNKKNLLNLLNKLPDSVKIEPLRTNGSIYDKEIMESLKRFKKVFIAFSYDSYGKALEYQRPNSNWSDMEKILDKFSEYSRKYKNIEIKNDFTVTWINVDTILDFYMKYSGIFSDIDYHPIQFPQYWQIKMLDPEYQKNILKNISFGVKAQSVSKYINDHIDDHITDDEINIMWKQIEYMKKYRNVNLEDKIPHLIPYLRKTSLQTI
jgi:organic radical activating enzyme